jgi:hypothetical protein
LERIGLAVAARAVAALKDPPADLATTLEELCAGGSSQVARDRAAAIVERLDERYFELNEREEETGQPTGWEEPFRQARAAAAVCEAAGLDPLRAATEATYEALYALDGDADAVLSTIMAT